ncbi:uncharacterized protein LOC143238568 isoform X1 [Tachypleus tridentatus]|uniref:uncharacterized protein LOC143238568 isoform X1 n=1 Tax=Tachypleus tridentatus TaxID=6853 RepID=UPI003FD20DAF
MCIRRELGFCSISYSEGERGGFDIGPHSKPATGPHCCRLAYLLIPTGSTGSEGLGNVGDRFCGRGLSPTGVVSSKIFPFEISFVSTIHMDETPFTQESDRHYRRFVSGRQMTGFIESTGNHTNNSESKRKRTQNSKFMRWFPDEESDHFYDKNTTLLGINDIKTSSMEITSKRQSFKDLKKPQTGKLVSNTENKGSFSYNNTKLDNKTSFTKHGLINSVVKKPKDDIKVGETFYNINYVLSYKINEVTQCDDKCNNGCRGKCINFCNNHEFEADIDIRKCRGNCYRTASDKCKENCRKQCEKDSVKQHNSEMYDENYDNEIDDDDSEGVEASDDDVKENNAENLEIRSSPVTKRFCVLNCETLCRGRCNNFCSDLPYKIEKILCRRKCKNSCPRKCFRVCDMDEDLECDCECGEITTGLCRHICQLKSLRHHWKAAGFNIYYSQNPCF